MPKITSLKQMLLLNAGWVGIAFLWNALHPIVLPALLLRFVPDAQKNTWLGVLTFSGLALGMFVQPLSGSLSDHWASRWGRRRPLLLLGTLFDFAFLAILGWSGGLPWLFVGYIGLQASSNFAQGALQGLLPDRVAPQRMGRAAALKTLMEMLSIVFASILAGHLVDPGSRDASLVILAIVAVLAAASAVTLLGTPEAATHNRPHIDLQGLLAHLRLDQRENPSYWWLTGERALFMLGVYGLQTFAQYYLQDVLRVPNPARQTGDMLAAITVGLIVLVLAGGWLTDRFGAKPVLLAGSLLASAGLLLILLARTPLLLVVFAAVVGAGVGLFMSSNWALANRLAPPEQAGKYLGLTYLVTTGAGALSRLEGPVIDLLNNVSPGQWLGYTAVFGFGVACTLGSLFFLNRVTIKQS